MKPESKVRLALPFNRSVLIGAVLLLSAALPAEGTVPVAPVVAQTVIDTDSPVYSNLQNKVLVSGSGIQGSVTYYLWLKKPGEADTSYVGIRFIATGGGSIPYPDVSIPLDVQPVLGSYLLTISTSPDRDTGDAKCHFGIVGTVRSVYQRRENARFVGGGALPGSTVRLDVRNPSGTIMRNATMIASESGEFEHAWSLPNNVQVGSWAFSVGGTGTLDNSLERFHAEGQFGVTEASLKMTIHQQPLEKYERTQTAKIALIIKYPDNSPVTTTKPNSKPVDIYRANIRTYSYPLTLSDPKNGIWIAEYVIPRNETLGKNATFSLSAGSFDDGFGNKAPSSPYISSQFEIVQAQIAVSISASKTDYQILFDSLSLNVSAKYPSGAYLTDGKVSVTFETGNWREQERLLFVEKSRSWILTHYLSVSEILHLGSWKVSVLAEDGYGNTGSSTIDVGVGILWFLVTSAALTVLAVVIVKWVKEEKALNRSTQKKEERKG